MRRQQDQQSRVFHELSALVLALLRSPLFPVQFSDHLPAVSSLTRPVPALAAPTQITPAGFASLLLGISLSLMLCGSVTFFIGFLLMPWVLGYVFVLYVIGIVSSLSVLGRAFISHFAALVSPPKDIPAWKLM